MQDDTTPTQPQPGEQIIAGAPQAQPPQPEPQPQPPEPAPPAPPLEPTPDPVPQPEPPVPTPAPQDVPPTSAPANAPGPVDQDLNTVTWSASEYIHHQKNTMWYFGLAAVTLLLALAFLFLLHDKFGPIIVVVMGIALGMYGARTPNTLNYQIGPAGVDLGPKHYGYENFKSFSTMQEDGVLSLQLNPMKRFMPAFSIYFDPKQADQIATTLGKYLPHEEMDTDAVDILARLLRF